MTSAVDYFFPSTDGLRLYCAIYHARRPEPAGLPILCLPGLTRNSRDFTTIALHLSEQHDVLACDLRGRGQSAWDPDATHYQLPTYVQDAWSLLESRRLERVVVLGTSLGALMGIVMAATQPQRIAGVILNDAGPEFDPAGVQRIAAYAGRLPAVASWAGAVAQTKSVYGQALPGLSDAEWFEFARRGYRENSQGIPVPDVDPRIAEAFSSSPGTADLWAVFAELKSVPLLVIRGELSDLLSTATVARMARQHPSMQQLMVANRGHTPLLTEPECIEAIDAFLSRGE